MKKYKVGDLIKVKGSGLNGLITEIVDTFKLDESFNLFNENQPPTGYVYKVQLFRHQLMDVTYKESSITPISIGQES